MVYGQQTLILLKCTLYVPISLMRGHIKIDNFTLQIYWSGTCALLPPPPALPFLRPCYRTREINNGIKGAFSSNVWNWNFKLSKNQLNHSILFYFCAERRTSRECVCLMAARHRYLFLRYALLNQTTLNMQNNRYVTWYTFTFPLIP